MALIWPAATHTHTHINSPDAHRSLSPLCRVAPQSVLVTSAQNATGAQGRGSRQGECGQGRLPVGGATSTEPGRTGVGQRKWDEGGGASQKLPQAGEAYAGRWVLSKLDLTKLLFLPRERARPQPLLPECFPDVPVEAVQLLEMPWRERGGGRLPPSCSPLP